MRLTVFGPGHPVPRRDRTRHHRTGQQPRRPRPRGPVSDPATPVPGLALSRALRSRSRRRVRPLDCAESVLDPLDPDQLAARAATGARSTAQMPGSCRTGPGRGPVCGGICCAAGSGRRRWRWSTIRSITMPDLWQTDGRTSGPRRLSGALHPRRGRWRLSSSATYPSIARRIPPSPSGRVSVGPTASRGPCATLDLPEDRRVALFLGLIRPYKGVDLLLEAAAGLPADSDWLIVVAGEPWGDLGEPARAQVDDARSRRAGSTRSAMDPRGPRCRPSWPRPISWSLPYRRGSQSAVAPMALAHGSPVLVDRGGWGTGGGSRRRQRCHRSARRSRRPSRRPSSPWRPKLESSRPARRSAATSPGRLRGALEELLAEVAESGAPT